jgi:hypothetical protein
VPVFDPLEVGFDVLVAVRPIHTRQC